MAILPFLLAMTKLFLLFFQISHAVDVITQLDSLPDGKTLVSEDGSFELGFFSPGSSTNRYVGIWYKNIPPRTAVWVANRDNPTKDNSSMLRINSQGKLVLLSQNQTIIWSANITKNASNPIVQLLDSGNLVLRDGQDENPQNYLWQSFDYPTDTFLPGMKIGLDLKKGLNRRLSAWKSWDDPSSGDFTWGLVLGSTTELVMWKGSTEYYRSGPWNGIRFNGKTNPLFDLHLVSNEDEVIYTYNVQNKSLITRVVLNQTIYSRQRYNWVEETQSWRLYSSVPRDNCDNYNLCGPQGNCVVVESPPCECLSGFRPKSPQNWDALDWTQGCVHDEPWICKVKNKDGFVRFSGLKLPDTRKSWGNASMGIEDCKAKCLENCSCTAYANLDVRGDGSGCAIWFGDLLDLRVASVSGQDLYIRMAASGNATAVLNAKHWHKRKVVAALLVAITLSLVLVMLFTCYYIYKSRRKFEEKTSMDKNDEGEQEDLELPIFEIATIVHATDDFSDVNKLGQGGFGPVYKGTLPDGQEIAVKRLSQSSGQGIKEFKNEVILCAKLQHRNLVKVLGCCIQGQEKMLIYEYMPNKSLDSFLFDSTQSKLLDWSKRFHIICGIARGLLYLHQDSRLRIIHRDLKASNVLLDSDLNPKISDFGMARTFGGDQIEGNTNRVAGTYGYMAPEYAIHGLFSNKSDVFSFGVLLLEILSGKKNRGVSYPNNGFNLIGHVWRLWKENRSMELLDLCLVDSCVESEVLRCIHIGLLCVQQHPDDRPNMALVVVMLSSDSVLAEPREPAFLIENITVEAESSSGKHKPSSINEMSISLLEAR